MVTGDGQQIGAANIRQEYVSLCVRWIDDLGKGVFSMNLTKYAPAAGDISAQLSVVLIRLCCVFRVTGTLEQEEAAGDTMEGGARTRD